MCTVLAWAGSLPRGLITHLLIEAESRGRDATGIAFREGASTQVYRRSIPASRFVREHVEVLSAARRSQVGIAHARRASHGNPVNAKNAHPFTYGKLVFAHNGFIHNSRAVAAACKADTLAKLELDPDNADLTAKAQYLSACTTDSMAIGPCLERMDLSALVGDMGLVWIRAGKSYCARSKKELSAANVSWNHKDGTEFGTVTIVASTDAIITRALDQCRDLEYDIRFFEIREGVVYVLEPDCLYDAGLIPVNEGNMHDDISSAAGSEQA